VAGAQTNELRQLLDVNPGRYVFFHVRADSSRLPRLIEASEKASALGARKTHALTLVGLGPKQQVLDFMVVREGLEPSTSAL
jgi:hypothetical protein